MLAFFVLLSIIGPFVAPYSPDQIFANSPVPAAAVGRALARHHEPAAGRVLPAAGRRRRHAAGVVHRRRDRHRAVGGRRRDRGLPGRAGRRPAVHAGEHLPGDARAAAAGHPVRLPRQDRQQRPVPRRPHHLGDGLGLGRPRAARADAVAAQPGLRRLGPDHRREPVGGSSSPRSCRTSLRSSRARSCSPCCTRSGPTPRWPSSGWSTPNWSWGGMLFYAAGRQRGADRVLVVVHPAWPGDRAARHRRWCC